MKRKHLILLLICLLCIPCASCKSWKWKDYWGKQDPNGLFQYISTETPRTSRYMYDSKMPGLGKDECRIVLNNRDKIPEDGHLVIPERIDDKLVTQIANFDNAEGLISIDMSQTKISAIYANTFYNCTHLKEVILSPYTLYVGSAHDETRASAFGRCFSLEKIEMPELETPVVPKVHFKTVDGVLYTSHRDINPTGKKGWWIAAYPCVLARKQSRDEPIRLEGEDLIGFIDSAFDHQSGDPFDISISRDFDIWRRDLNDQEFSRAVNISYYD